MILSWFQLSAEVLGYIPADKEGVFYLQHEVVGLPRGHFWNTTPSGSHSVTKASQWETQGAGRNWGEVPQCQRLPDSRGSISPTPQMTRTLRARSAVSTAPVKLPHLEQRQAILTVCCLETYSPFH